MAMTPQNYLKLKDKIVEANESILDLVFGCEVEYKNLIWRIVHKSIAGDIVVQHEYSREIITPQQIEYLKTIKILGRPIQLADVLIALKTKRLNENGWIMVDIQGQFITVGNEELGILWDLSKNLYDQPEATLQFLFDLLVK
jgi:hypothetical protein